MKTLAPIYGARAALAVLVFYLVVTSVTFLVNEELIGGWKTTLASITIQVIGFGTVVTATVTIWRGIQNKIRQNQVR